MRRIQDWLSRLGQQLNLFDTDNEPISAQKGQFDSQTKTSLSTTIQPTDSKLNSHWHTITLQQQIVPYRLERSRRKTVGMMVDAQGLRVRAAPRVPIHEIERILYSKSRWILKSLDQAAQQKSQPVSFVPDLNVAEGESIRVLGQMLCVRWSRQHAFHADVEQSDELFVKPPRMNATMSLEEIADKRRNALANALGDYLLRYVNQRAQYFANEFNLHYRHIVLSNATTLWGTCRRDGLIRLNWRLVFLDRALVDYVLVHELAHTVHMNHSAAFWSQVERMCPDYRALRHQLKQFDLRHA